MKRIFNLVLVVCGLILAMHLSMTVYTEVKNNSRWAMTEEGRTGIRVLTNRMGDPFKHGGDPVNSALVLDFRNNEEPATIDAVESWIYFDFDGRGQTVKTGWIGAGAGFLVFDPNNQGLVTDGRQLFGNRTFDGDPRTLTGFAALAKLDDNGDGLIDQRDAGWAKLRVWLDKKPDGLVGFNELHTLEQLKIVALELKPQTVDKFLWNQNYLHSRASFIYANGRRGHLDEIFFQHQPSARKYKDGPTVSPEITALAPDIRGSGLMRDFRVALMQSPELLSLYRHFQNAERQEQQDLMDDILKAWSEAGGIEPDLTERLGNRYDVSGECLEGMEQGRLDRLRVIEAWSGRHFYRLPHELYPGQELLPGVEANEERPRELKITCPNDRWQSVFKNYDQLSAFVYEQLLRGTRLKPYYDRLDLSKKEDFSLVLALFDDGFALNPEKTMTDLLEFRLNLAWGKAGIKDAPALDSYIKSKIEQVNLNSDQRHLYDRVLALGATENYTDDLEAEPGETSHEAEDFDQVM